MKDYPTIPFPVRQFPAIQQLPINYPCSITIPLPHHKLQTLIPPPVKSHDQNLHKLADMPDQTGNDL